MAGNSKICIRIQSPPFLSEFIYSMLILFETSNLRVQRNSTLNLECKEVRDQFLQKLDFSYIFRDSTVSTLQKMYGKTAPTVTGIISPDRQKFFSFAQDRKRGNQKHRLRQEIPFLCRQLTHCFGQYYRENICIAFCKRRRNFRFFCSVNHLSRPLRQQMFISKSSKGHALYFVIGGFRSVFISRIVTCVRPVSGNYRLVRPM